MLAKLALAASAFATVAALPPQAAPAPQSAPAAASGRYDIDNLHSAVLFRINHLGASSSWGRFNQIKGSLILDAEKPAESMITLEIDARSIDTNDEAGVPDEQKDARDKHLRSVDFFNVEEFPAITFESEKVVPKGGGKFEITGPMTMHGVTKSITVTAEYVGTATGAYFGTVAGYDARFTIARADFGMNYAPDALGKEIEVILSLEAKKR